jgi:Tol biopolymer transport system component
LLDSSFKAVGTQKVTFGSANESNPSVAATAEGLRVAFSSNTSSSDLWSRDMAAPGAREWVRLTNDLALKGFPHLSADGRKLVYQSNRTGNFDIWLRDMDSGKETALTTGPEDEQWPRISPDGSHVVYATGVVPGLKLFVLDVKQAQPKLVCSDCSSMPHSFSPDNRFIFARLQRQDFGVPIGLVDIATGAKTPLAQRPGAQISGGVLSPDGKWMAFYPQETNGAHTVFVAPTGPRRPVPVSEWVQVGKTGESPGFDVAWSADGTKVYSSSLSLGELYAQPVDSATKSPVGPAVVIAREPLGKSLETTAFGGNRIVAVFRETHGNIWMVTLPE